MTSIINEKDDKTAYYIIRVLAEALANRLQEGEIRSIWGHAQLLYDTNPEQAANAAKDAFKRSNAIHGVYSLSAHQSNIISLLKRAHEYGVCSPLPSKNELERVLRSADKASSVNDDPAQLLTDLLKLNSIELVGALSKLNDSDLSYLTNIINTINTIKTIKRG